MTHLRKMMLEELERRNYAQTTRDCYIQTIEDFARYFKRPPDQLGPEHIREYQAYLFRERKLAARTVTQRLAALRFNCFGFPEARHPFSPVPPHETTSPSSHTRCSSPPASVVCPCLPPNQLSVPNLDPKSRPHHTQTLTQPILASPLPAPVPVPQASLLTPTRLNRHNRLPRGGFLQTAVSDAPRGADPTCTPTVFGARPIQH